MCQQCNGSKYIRYDVPLGHPMFGKIFPCQLCNQENVIRASGLNPTEREVSFDALSIPNGTGTVRMVSAAKRFLQSRKGILSIYGRYGNGKSTVLKAIVAECTRAGIEARYMTMYEVMAYAKEAFESKQQGDSDAGRITRLAQTMVLCIDELDKARLTDYAVEVQTHFFDARYRNADTLGTVVAWNGDLQTIPLPWVMSRLSEFEMVENADPDIRPLLGGKA